LKDKIRRRKGMKINEKKRGNGKKRKGNLKKQNKRLGKKNASSAEEKKGK
jgi:hypothetical protein